MLLNCGVGEDSWECLGLQGDPTSPFWRRSALGFLWKEWCWSWNPSTLSTSCEELTHWKSLWCCEGLRAGGEGDDRGWGGWMASLTRWMWVWVNSGSWWWTGRPGVLRFMGSQRVGHDWATELNWTDGFYLNIKKKIGLQKYQRETLFLWQAWPWFIVQTRTLLRAQVALKIVGQQAGAKALLAAWMYLDLLIVLPTECAVKLSHYSQGTLNGIKVQT